jgi:hypothetical protein
MSPSPWCFGVVGAFVTFQGFEAVRTMNSWCTICFEEPLALPLFASIVEAMVASVRKKTDRIRRCGIDGGTKHDKFS